MERNNITSVLTLLIKKLRIPISREGIVSELQKHPDYSSLLSISDVLDYWNVPNASYSLSFDELMETEMPEYFIAYFASKEFVLVSSINEEFAIVANEHWNNHKMSLADFKKNYAGSVLVAEKSTNSREADYNSKKRAELIEDYKFHGVIGCFIAILLSAFLVHPSFFPIFSWQIVLLTVFKTLGLVIGILLLAQSINSNNPLIQKMCGGDSKKNCNAILSSKAAKVTSWLSWSEVGFFYFAGTWLALLFANNNAHLIPLLAILNLVSLPYTFYSIYHQWKVAKQWCVLCCTVQALLWLEFLVFLPYLNQTGDITFKDCYNLAASMLLPVLGWVFLKSSLLKAQQLQPLTQQLRRFKYNKDLFNKLLEEQTQYKLLEESASLILGNPEAENVVTMVSNPYCQPCAKAHKILDEWLNNSNNIKLQVVFSTHTDGDAKTKVASHLISLRNANVKDALNDWYEAENKSYSAWANNYPLKEEASSKELLNLHKEWCEITDITATPTIFFNGRRLPSPYKPEDIKYII